MSLSSDVIGTPGITQLVIRSSSHLSIDFTPVCIKTKTSSPQFSYGRIMFAGAKGAFCLVAIGLLLIQHVDNKSLRKRGVSKMTKSLKSQSIVFGGKKQVQTAIDPNACVVFGYEENLSKAILYNDFFDYLNQLQIEYARSIYYPPDFSSKITDGQSFDIIIVGGGISGCLTAKLLAQSGCSVLILEAGPDAPISSAIPALWHESIQDSKLDWGFVLESNPSYGLGLKDNVVRLNQARVLGGSSIINDMIHDRGSQYDYERWEGLNMTGWTYSDMDAIYTRIERTKLDTVRTETESETVTVDNDGTVTITTIKTEKINLLRSTFSKAFEDIGFKSPDTFTVSDHVGIAPPMYYLKDGQRMIASSIFLRAIKDKNTVQVSKNSEVTKLCFDETKTKVTGVEFRNPQGKTIKVNANREVVLAANSINSVRILQQSGVGDAALLSKYNIPLVKNLPGVGKRLSLHPMFFGLSYTFTKTPVSSYTINEIIYEYLTQRTGRFTDIGMSNFIGYLDTDFKGNPDVAVTQYYFPAQDTLFLRGHLKAWNVNDDLVERFVKVNADKPILIIGLVSLCPKAEGVVEINSNDPTKNPTIRYPLYTEEEDIKNILTAVKMVDRVMKYRDFKNFQTNSVQLEIKECAKCKYQSEEYYRCAIKYLSTTTNHPTGTLRMGPPSDPLAVVGPDFRVNGFSNLRVVGEPVIPVEMVTDSSAVALMLAERCATFIQSPVNVTTVTKTTVEKTSVISED
ncbi:hypothetical protein M8J77_005879 [Diaphorina citri]|nr:hypothetical protein M8J77_005879 [Diaphorina citri]